MKRHFDTHVILIIKSHLFLNICIYLYDFKYILNSKEEKILLIFIYSRFQFLNTILTFIGNIFFMSPSIKVNSTVLNRSNTYTNNNVIKPVRLNKIKVWAETGLNLIKLPCVQLSKNTSIKMASIIRQCAYF